jgi:IS5 family transposase
MKTDGHLGRCYLKGAAGEAANAALSAVGYNLRLVLAWLILRLILIPRPVVSELPLKMPC